MKHIEKKVIDLTLPVTALIGVNKLIQIQKKNDLMNYNTSVNKFELENCSSFPSFVHSFYIRCSNSFPYFGTKVVIISYRGSEVRRTKMIFGILAKKTMVVLATYCILIGSFGAYRIR
jgi:hypothetical protein